jgi:T4-like virus tail tube protein gp19
MVRSTARRKGTWLAPMLAALIVGLTLLVVLTSPGSHPRPAQAQTAVQLVELSANGNVIATFGNVAEATSSINLPRADGKAAQLEPIRIVLERTADENLALSTWHRQASTQLMGYRRDATLTFFDITGDPTLRLSLKSAWPAEYQIEQQGDQVVERVTLTATSFERVAP